jgi:GrpB-like predicted nucleotidyltransferase (UPF0157 family)
MRKIILPYDACWPSLFEAEARALQGIFGETVLALHHVGSTAIPGLVAKPIIDILAEVRCLEEVDQKTVAMESCGYEARGAHGIEGRRYFNKARADPDGVGFHIHAFARGSSQIRRHLRFRDYLIAVPDAAKEYATLKLSLCDPSGVLVPDYAERKAPFIELIDRRANARFVSETE